MLSIVTWNWQQPDWPNFSWEAKLLAEFELQYVKSTGIIIGTRRHLGQAQREEIMIELMSDEIVATSAIEGEVLERESVQSSLRRRFGLSTPERRIHARESAVSEVHLEVFRNAIEPLTAAVLFRWHERFMYGRSDLANIGAYRTFHDPMQIVTGHGIRPEVHFEAPPSARIPQEMERFLSWFSSTGPGGTHPLPAITRAGLAHLYFESIHPFEDGNGRIGRAISEKALAQGAGDTQVSLLATTMLRRRKEYYAALQAASTHNEVSDWLTWFAKAVLESQQQLLRTLNLVLEKAAYFDVYRDRLNERHEKVLLRLFDAGEEGFTGGLSAAKYISITGVSTATATRDLTYLVEIGALRQTGELRYRRYHLALP